MSFISFSARRLYGGGRDDDREGWTSYCFVGCRAGSGKVHSEIGSEGEWRAIASERGWME